MKENWTYKKFGEVFNLQMGKTPSRDNFSYWGGDNIWVSIADLKDKYIDSTKEHITDLAVSESGIHKVPQGTAIMSFKLTIGRAAITKCDLFTNEAIMSFEPKETDTVLADYVYYYLKGCKWMGANKAVMGQTLNKKTITDNVFAYPPIETQSRIVSELDLLQSIIDKQKAQLKELDNLAQAVFYDMFGDPVENEKGWEVKKLGEVCTFLQGEQVPIEEQFFEKKDGTIRFLRIVDFTQGNEEPRYVYCKDEKHILHDKEIAIVRYGTPGFVCYGKFGLIANNLFKVVPKNINSFDFRYLVSWLESSAFQSTVQDNQYGAALQAIKFGTIQNINIIMPPLIESIEKQKATITKSIEESQKLFDYTMDKYFG